jgi:RNA polymerase sigma factor (sigma-70 family)
MTTVSDQDWIRLIRQQDEKALNDLWEMLYDVAVRVARKYNQPDDAGYDAAVQTYRRLLRNGLSQFQFRSSLRSYCWTILSRELCRKLTNEVATVELTVEPMVESTPYRPSDLTRIMARIQPCIDRLTPQRRRVFELVDLHGMTPAAAAVEIGIERNNVNQLAARARRDLRTCLQQRGFENSEELLSL